MMHREAQNMQGASVVWQGIDERIYDATLDKIGKHHIATISFRVVGKSERFQTYKHVKELFVQARPSGF